LTCADRGLEIAQDFARRCAGAGIEVELTAVERPDVDVDAVRELADKGGLGFRLRSYHAPPPPQSRV